MSQRVSEFETPLESTHRQRPEPVVICARDRLPARTQNVTRSVNTTTFLHCSSPIFEFLLLCTMSVEAVEGVEYDLIVQNGPKKVSI